MADLTRSAKDLAAWLSGSGNSQAQLARELGVHRSLPSRWVTGSARPSLPLAQAIEARTGVSVYGWLWADEQARCDELARLR